jgi:BirA family biotin operon repressor/biotin-[acetyl-CoA-carboxylase] ligase
MARHVAPDLGRAADAIRAKGARLGEPLKVLSETTSTNDEAKAGARDGAPHGALWVAESQSGGRGRQGRTWVSPPGENLLFSVLLRIPCILPRVPGLSLACGLAVRDAVAHALGIPPAADTRRVLVKWPNDVVVASPDGKGFRKVAGILVESALSGSKLDYLVVGIGVNVHTRTFEGDLANSATSISLECSSTPDRAEILADILSRLDQDIEHVAQRGLGLVHARLSAHDALRDRSVESEDGSITGIGAGIDMEGRLLVRRDDGVVAKIVSGEMRLRRA